MAAKTKINEHGDVIFSEEDAIDLLYTNPEFDISKLYFNEIQKYWELKPKTIYQGVAEKYPHYLADSNMDFHEVEIDKPEFVDYLTGDENYYVPEWIVSENDTEKRFREKLRSRDE